MHGLGSSWNRRVRSPGVGVALLALALTLPSAVHTVHGSEAKFAAAMVDAFGLRYGPGARRRLLDWESIMLEHRGQPSGDKRRAANDFFNAIPWISDDEHWGKRDYWATPMEMLGTDGGDCEDFSIGKYFTLAELRVPTAQLLITYVRAPKLKQTHMVLAFYPTPDADPLILDNLTGEILPGSQRADLIPVYSFNGTGLWKAVERGRGQRVGDANGLLAWRNVLGRMASELGG